MDFLSIIDQALSDVGIESSDDPEFVTLLRGAAPVLDQVASQLRNQLRPETPAVPGEPRRNGSQTDLDKPDPARSDEVVESQDPGESPEPGTLAYDIEAGIPVFFVDWPYHS
ncbi:MAG: hypothetical protein MJE77_06745 [Proteobacteria bacterium]|nr:hypothetical protein [Pseudomonadota bacterium]